MVSLTANDKGRSRVTSVIALPKGMGCPTQINPTFYLSLDPQEFDQATFDKLSDKMKEMIRKSPEFEAVMRGPVTTVEESFPNDSLDEDADIPF